MSYACRRPNRTIALVASSIPQQGNFYHFPKLSLLYLLNFSCSTSVLRTIPPVFLWNLASLVSKNYLSWSYFSLLQCSGSICSFRYLNFFIIFYLSLFDHVFFNISNPIFCHYVTKSYRIMNRIFQGGAKDHPFALTTWNSSCRTVLHCMYPRVKYESHCVSLYNVLYFWG